MLHPTADCGIFNDFDSSFEIVFMYLYSFPFITRRRLND